MLQLAGMQIVQLQVYPEAVEQAHADFAALQTST
jgi:hypothetical protein